MERSTRIAKPSKPQELLARLPENVLGNVLATAVVAVPGALVTGAVAAWGQLAPYAPIGAGLLLGVAITLLGVSLRKHARRAVERWTWTPNNAIRVTFESAEISADSKEFFVWLRCTNISPFEWVLNHGRIEHFQVGYARCALRALDVCGVLPGSCVLPAGGSVVVPFRGECPPLDGNERWWPVFLGAEARPGYADGAQTGFVFFSRGYPDDPAVQIPPLIGTARRRE